MDQETIEQAKEQLATWLEHPSELGKRPVKIEYTNTFAEGDGLECMIFKYKKSVLSKWMLGIVSNIGISSQMQEYHKDTEVEDAREVLEYLKKYWKQREECAEEDAERDKKKGSFFAAVLLEHSGWDKEQFKRDFESDWNIPIVEEDENAAEEKYKDVLIFSVGTQTVVIGCIDAPVPDQEAERNASMNYMWKEAVDVTKKHQAQIVVALLGEHEDVAADSRLYVKTVYSMCKQKNVLGVNANGIVYQPKFYREVAKIMGEDGIPLLNVIWFGLVQTKEGVSGYTVGLYQFGKDEIEVLNVQDDPESVRNFVMSLTEYVVESDVILRDGETIGFSAEQKLAISRSEGNFTEGMTLKIEYGREK